MIRTLINKILGKEDIPYGEYLKLKTEHEYLKIRYEELQKQYLFQRVTHKDIPIAGFDELDDLPSDRTKRNQYIADVTLFFDNILHKRIKTGIAEIRELLSNIGRQEGTPLSLSRVEYDMFLRGMEAALWKMHDWAIALDAERKQELQDKNNQDGTI